MHPLRHQIQQLAQAPGIAQNPFEKILAGFGIVRDDVRQMAMSDYSNARRQEMYDARRKAERGEIDASAQTRADLQLRNMQEDHKMKMERMNAPRNFAKDHEDDGGDGNGGGDDPNKKEKGLMPPKPVNPLADKRRANGVRPDGDAYIKDIEEGIRDFNKTGGTLGLNPLAAPGLSKAYDAKVAKREKHKADVEAAAAAAGKGKPKTDIPNNSNVQPFDVDASSNVTQAPIPGAVTNTMNLGEVKANPDFAQTPVTPGQDPTNRGNK